MSKKAIGCFVLAAVFLLSVFILRFLFGTIPFNWVLLGLSAASLIFGIWIDRQTFAEFLTMKTTRQGMSMGSLILLVLVFIVAINFIAVKKSVTWDFSLGRVNTLSEQSIQLLNQLQSDLKVFYFYKDGTEGVEQNRRAFIDLIRKYQDRSDKIKLEFVEVNSRPDLTAKYKIEKGTQAVILEYKDRTSLIEKVEEQELTSGIVKVTREGEKKVLFIGGHGELPLEGSADGRSVAVLKALLEGNRYKVENHNFASSPSIPGGTDVVVVAGPLRPYLDVEIKALTDYLTSGGALILALDPSTAHGFKDFLNGYAIDLGENFIATVMETPIGRAVDPRFTRGTEYLEDNEITKPFAKNDFTLFRLPQEVRAGTTNEGIKISKLVGTGTDSMAFAKPEFQGASGEKGPFAIAQLVEGPQIRMIVFGDSDFLNDQYLYQGLNRDLMLNAIAFLAKEKNLISISPRQVAATEMNITETQMAILVFGFAIPLPFALFGTSLVLWYRRRGA